MQQQKYISFVKSCIKWLSADLLLNDQGLLCVSFNLQAFVRTRVITVARKLYREGNTESGVTIGGTAGIQQLQSETRLRRPICEIRE